MITVLSLFLRRSLKSAISGYWLVAWSSLSLALFCLSLAFSFEEYAKPLYAIYFWGEYLFGLMLVTGCRNLSGKKSRALQNKLITLPFIALASVLAFLARDFTLVFHLHALIISGFLVWAYFVLKDLEIKTFGWRVMRVALFLLGLNFFHYSILFTTLQLGYRLPIPDGYLEFNPIIDLVLEVLLGFGMIIVLLEKVLREARDSNEKLRAAHEKLEQLAQTDPLTTAFNRHAFYGFLKKRGEGGKVISGCVGFFDIDNLKPINDRYGHTVGDLAIRSVVGAIRGVMRAEDLIFRWGGDEFFVIMVSMNAEMARARMERLEMMLTDIQIEGVAERLSIGVSYGFKDFAEISELEQAVKSADEEMYRRKQERKAEARQAKINLAAAAIHESTQPNRVSITN